jgi:hypothetical protein
MFSINSNSNKMQSTNYIDVDSTYRNRNKWPNPGQFELLNDPGMRSTAKSSLDSVSTMSPDVAWQSNRFDPNVSGSNPITCEVTAVSGYGSTSTGQAIVFKGFGGATLQQIDNYYAHAVVHAPPGGAYTTESRVLSYTYLGGLNEGKIVLLSNTTLTDGDLFELFDPTDLAVNRVFVPTSPFIPNAYGGLLLNDETTNSSVKIVNFDELTGTVVVESPIPGWTITDSFSIRQTTPTITDQVAVGSTQSYIIPAVPISAVFDLSGSHIRIDPTYPAVAPSSETRAISQYDTLTNRIYINPPLSAVPTPGMVFEILQWSFDIYNPLNVVSTRQQELVDSTVRLLNLVLPNRVLDTLYGGRVSNLPYVYVTLTPLNSSSLLNTLTSNNPNAKTMMFKAMRLHHPMADDIAVARFDGADMRQRIKYRSDGDYMFKVILPNGELFKTIEDDTASPFRPDPKLQISALFEVVSLLK